MKKVLLTFVAVLCTIVAMASEVKDLVAINGDYQYTPTAALTENTLYDNGKVLSLGGSGYSKKGDVKYNNVSYSPVLQIKNSRQIAMKIACKATVTVIGSTNSSRSWRIGTKSAGNEIADGGNGGNFASGEVDGSTTPVVIYINASADLYLATVIVKAAVDDSKVSTPAVSSQWGESFGDPTTVTISCSTEGASVYYTTDGTTPTSSSTLYSEPFNVTSNCTVKAIGIKDGLTNSALKLTFLYYSYMPSTSPSPFDNRR